MRTDADRPLKQKLAAEDADIRGQPRKQKLAAEDADIRGQPRKQKLAAEDADTRTAPSNGNRPRKKWKSHMYQGRPLILARPFPRPLWP